jgi:hypothetical protein
MIRGTECRGRIRLKGRKDNMKKWGCLLACLTYVVLLSILVLSCDQPENNWAGTIESVDGISVVMNPNISFYGEFVALLEEDLSIGNEDDDNYRFYRARAIALDSENNIYVVDLGNYRVQKFDEMGRYLQTIGRKGQGPGEFQGPLRVFVDARNSLYVSEYKKIHVFDNHGQYKSSFSLDYHLVDFAVDSDGHILGYSDLHQRDTARRGIIKMDSQGKIVKTIQEYTDLGIKVIIGETATFTLSPNHVYTPRLFFATLGQDAYAYGYASEYLINLIDREGNPLLRIRKSDEPIPISQKEKDFIINTASESLEQRQIPISKEMIEETMHFKQNRAFFNRILADEMRRLYIQRVKGVIEKNEHFEFDIFSSEGYYLYRVQFPFSPEIITNGFLYDIQTNEETGEVQIKRHKVTNWDQMKARLN